MTKVTFISDTHGQHRNILSLSLEGDVLCHCGDFMTDGYSLFELRDFLEWFSSVGNFKHRIFIAGNHDRLFEESLILKRQLLKNFENLIYLEDSEFTLPNGLKIYGTPYQPAFRDWAFNLPRHGEELKSKYAAIPDDTDILLTHSAPNGILDEVDSHNTGSKALLQRVREVKPKIHAFGHIHECPGYHVVESTTYINAAQVDRDYKVVNEPITIEWSDIE